MINPVEIGNSIAKQILFESDDTKKVVIYSGRFQPFHEGHYLTYSHLVKKFGKDNVFIGTSDKVEKPKSPLNFKEKVKVMTTMFGIPKNKIVQVKNPYAPKEILSKFPQDTVFVTVVGDKDASRLSGKYFQKYEDGIDFSGYMEKGYIYVSPSLSTLSGTQVRSMLGDPSLSEEEKKLNFKKIYGKFNQSIFDLVTSKLTESIVEKWLIERGGKLFEGSVSSIGPDDGPAFVYPNFAAYKGATKRDLKKFLETGWGIVKYMVDDSQEREFNPPIYPNGPIDSVSFFPAGDLGNVTPNNQRDIYGVKAYDTWKKHILNIIKTIGWEYIESRQQQRLMKKLSGDAAKDIKGNINESFDRVDFYKSYFENLIPDGFEIKKQNNSIIITQKLIKEGVEGGEPESSYLDGDEILRLGTFSGRPDPWFEQGGYTQLSFPKADYIYGRGGSKDTQSVQRKVYYKLKNVTTSTLPDVEKDDVKISNEYKKDKVKISKKNNKITKPKINENLIAEGGAYGHLAHPFEDMNLTFGDLKKMIELGLSGELNVESSVTEKTDGQNLSISWRDDKGGLIAARNKSHIKDNGVNALTINGLKQMFKGRGEIENAFSYAVDDLNTAISSLTDKQRDKIFANGSKFMSLEVIYMGTENVIPYGMNMLVFHGTMEYDENGNTIGEDKGSSRILAGMIKQVNQDVQNTFQIKPISVVQLPKSRDFSKSKSKYFSRLNKLQSQFNLKDSDTLGMYHQKWWENFIQVNANKYKYPIPNQVFIPLMKRWAFGDKSFAVRTMKKEIDNQKFLDWVLSFDKQNHQSQVKENIRPFEELFLEVGAEILMNLKDLMTVNPKESVKKLRNEIDKAISELRKSTDPNVIKKFKRELQRIEALGGLDKLVPTEGIVFVFKGKSYKLTGIFAPINQLLGIFRYG